MAARGHIPPTLEGRAIQAPGMMRHGPFPGLGVPGHRPLEVLPSEFLENKIAAQAAEAERLMRENQRLAATHGALRQELAAVQQETQRVQAHIGSIQTESDIQIRGLLDKIAKMEADLRASEGLKKDLQQAHMEAQNLVTARQELTAQIQQASQELQGIHSDFKKLPEMHADLDSLRQEHQRLRSSFEYEKGLNMEQVEQMQAMEKNLVTMAREVEKLRAEALNAEKRVLAPAPNLYGGAYSSPDSSYGAVAHGGSYADAYGRPQVQMNGGVSADGMTPYGASSGVAGSGVAPASGGVVVGSSYPDVYGRQQIQVSGGSAGDAMNPYGGNIAAAGSGYVDSYGRPQVQNSGAIGEGMNPYLAAGASAVPGSGGRGGPYDAARGAPPLARR